MSEREALKLALAALEHEAEIGNDDAYRKERDAIKKVLAQPEQEPVAWMWRCKPYCGWPEWSVSLKRPADSGRDGHKRTEGYEDVPLYTSPPASKPWVGLTEDEIMDMYNEPRSDAEMITFGREVEAALKEKNT